MSDDIRVTIEERDITAELNSALPLHGSRHEEGGTDEVDLDKLNIAGDLDLEGFDLLDDTQTIWDATNQYIPQGRLENSDLTVTAGDGLKNGGVVSLGGSTTLDLEPADIAGTFLSDDGLDNLTVDLGRGLENDGSGNIQFDEDTSYTFTTGQTFNGGITVSGSVSLPVDSVDATEVDIGRGLEDDGTGSIQFDEDTSYTFTTGQNFDGGLDTQGDVTDGTQTIWDATGQEIPDSAMGSIDNSTLTNDSVTVTAGDGLKGGGSVALGSSTTVDVEPADIAGTFLSDDGADDLQVDIGRGLENDGSDNIRINEDASLTWTSGQTFNGGITAGGAIDLQNTHQVTNAPSPTDAGDLARKQYVDNVVSGATDVKESVRASSTANIDLASTTDPNPVDGVTLNDGDRVLLQEQTDATENGLYVAQSATDPSTWVRTADADEDAEVTSGMFTFVEEGTSRGSTSYIVTTDDPITLGTTAINFAQFSSAGEITAGDGLTKSGQTLNIEPADFAGTFLSDDGSDNLTVDLGEGLENDGSGNVRVDEDESFTFTTTQTFNAGLDTQGDVTDGTQVIWDATGQEIPDSAMGSIDNTTLTNDSVTVTAGDGLQNGGLVALGGTTTLDIEPADFAGTFLSDDGSDNLTVDLGRGLENDGSGNIQFDEDESYTFTSQQQFNADIIDGVSNVVYDQSNNWVPQTRLENDSVTITAGDGLQNGGLVALGGSTTLDIEPADFAGTFLSDDGSDNLTVNTGRGIENDGTGALQFDEDESYTFTSQQTFDSSIDTTRVDNDDYKESQATATTGATHTVDISQSNFHLLTLGADTSFTFGGVDAGQGNQVTLRLKQDGTGGRIPSWPSNVEWPGGVEPSWSTSAGATDVVAFAYDNQDSVWYGFPGGLNFS